MSARSPDSRHDVLTCRGTPIHYWVHGDADAPMIACTHGASLDHDAFAPNLHAMVAAGYRVLTWDMPGHGASQPRGDVFDIEAVAADLLALLDAVGTEHAALVGQSLGGLVSQQLHIEHPERVGAMAMIGSTDLRDPLTPGQALIQRMRPAVLRVWPDAHLRRTFARMFAESPQARSYVERATRQQSKNDLIEVTRAALAAVLAGHRGPRPPVPILLLHGDRDIKMAIASARRWEANEPACQRAALPDAGHLANLDQPHAYNQRLIEFLQLHMPATLTS